MNFRIRCAGKALLVVVAIGVLGGVVMMLWNWVMPAPWWGPCRCRRRWPRRSSPKARRVPRSFESFEKSVC